MARRTFASDTMLMSALEPEGKSTVADFDQRFLFLYRNLRALVGLSAAPPPATGLHLYPLPPRRSRTHANYAASTRRRPLALQ